MSGTRVYTANASDESGQGNTQYCDVTLPSVNRSVILTASLGQVAITPLPPS